MDSQRMTLGIFRLSKKIGGNYETPIVRCLPFLSMYLCIEVVQLVVQTIESGYTNILLPTGSHSSRITDSVKKS